MRVGGQVQGGAEPAPGASEGFGFGSGPGRRQGSDWSAAEQIGCYRANFRFAHTTCLGNLSWFYEDWLVLIANDWLRADGFLSGEPDHDVDHRVHLYG